MSSPQLILASASPRRRELLALMGVTCTVRPSEIDEALHDGESPEAYVSRLADAKMRAIADVADVVGSQAVLAADTIVVCDDQILGKPRDRADALAMLRRLSGRWHRVLSAVTLRAGGRAGQALTDTAVCFRALDDAECAAYWDSGEPHDKAGAYGIQGLGGCFVSEIRGSYSGVVGLPMAETLALLRGAGIPCGPGAVRA
ncbi:MAG: septum formation inhibitor Maf [Gammaproteobacteria bacterium]|nr:septum formation inhibitor Maf [Gammaproteobacteria bacterium]